VRLTSKALIVIIPVSFFASMEIAALPQNPSRGKACTIPEPRTNPPGEIGRCLCGDFISDFGDGVFSRVFCKCAPNYFVPSHPNIPSDNCSVGADCSNADGGPCKSRRKYVDYPDNRDIPNWSGGIMPKFGVYSNFDLFGGG